MGWPNHPHGLWDGSVTPQRAKWPGWLKDSKLPPRAFGVPQPPPFGLGVP
jgi:hypothetical protein